MTISSPISPLTAASSNTRHDDDIVDRKDTVETPGTAVSNGKRPMVDEVVIVGAAHVAPHAATSTRATQNTAISDSSDDLFSTSTDPSLLNSPTKQNPPGPKRYCQITTPDNIKHLGRPKPFPKPPPDRCCNCSKRSKCLRKNCTCVANNRNCTNCACQKCENQGGEESKNSFLSALSDANSSPATIKQLSNEKTDNNSQDTPTGQLDKVISKENNTVPTTTEDEGNTTIEQTTPSEVVQEQLPPDPNDQINNLMFKVYGDYVHQDDGTQLDGGVQDDNTWQKYWRRLVAFPVQSYQVPNGSVGRRFVSTLAEIMKGIKARKSNSEKLIVFILVVLQRDRDIKSTRDIRKRLTNRMDEWKDNKFEALVQDTISSCESFLSSRQKEHSPEQRNKIFQSLMLRGEIRSAVRFITDREKGGVLLPNNIANEETMETVEDILRSKHPTNRIPDVEKLPKYHNTPELIAQVYTPEHIESVARRLSGSSGLGGVDAFALSNWLLRFGTASADLRKAAADFTNWLANNSPPWAAYRSLMACRLVAIDKCPGVRPIGIGELWRRLFAKTVISVCGKEAKQACGTLQLCAGLESGIEGGIHSINSLWEQMHGEDEYGFLLVDAKNAFNEMNRTTMLWVVRHEWPSGARFVFNCYRHHTIMVIRGNNGSGATIHSQEGVTQGDPLSMVVYGIGILPLIRHLKKVFSDITHTWYADDALAASNFSSIRKYFECLVKIGPEYGYYPEPRKSILVVTQQNLLSAKAYFSDLKFQVTTGNRYLGGFLGEEETKTKWLQDMTRDWKIGVQELAKVASKYPQSAFCGLQKSLQTQWQYLQRVCKNTGDAFSEVEKAIANVFLPALFNEPFDTDDPRRALTELPVKFAGLSLPNPVNTATSNFENSILMNAHLIRALTGSIDFKIADHLSTVREVRSEIRKRNAEKHNTQLTYLAKQLSDAEQRTIMRGKDTGQWLSVVPSQLNGTVLSPQEFRDGLALRYAYTPKDLPRRCDGCDQPFDMQHGLLCKKGGLVVRRHNEIRDELGYLVSQALAPSAVRDEPLINHSHAVEEAKNPETSPVKNNKDEERGDLLIRGFWSPATDLIVDVRITDLDSKSYRKTSPEKAIAKQEKEKKDKYLSACLERRKHFTPFVVSADGLKGKEALALLRRLAAMLSDKWQRPYADVCGYVNARMSIAIIRAMHLCIRGSRVPATLISNRRPLWDDKAGVGLFQCY